MIGIDGTIQMLEPFTRVRINLPPLSTFPDIADYQPDRLDEEYTIRRRRSPHGYTYTGSTYNLESTHMQKAYVDKIIISAPPDDDDDQNFMAVAIYGEFSKLCYCRRGDKTWTDFPRQKSVYRDVIFHGEKIYAVNFNRCICEYDTRTMLKNISKIPQHISPDKFCRPYLVGMEGGLLLVTRHTIRHEELIEDVDSINIDYYTNKFHVYKLEELKGGEARWLEIKSLGNYVLVLGLNSSVSILSQPIPHNKGNRIYYSDDYLEGQYSEIRGGHDNGVFDLKNQTAYQFFSNSNFIYPAPIWLLSV